MRRGGRRLPLLAEIDGPAEAGAWSLRRGDFDGLGKVLPKLTAQRVVLVAGEGEEPAVAAIALATAAVAGGLRTIVVDCDLAQPRLAAQLGLAAAPGLHEYLRWEAEPGDVLRPVALAGPAAGATDPLVCVCGGRPATKAETLLGLQSFSHMVEKLRHGYELTLLLAPPVESEASACGAVAAEADAAIAAVPAAAKGRAGRAVRKAIRRLPPPAIGTIAVKG